MKNPGLCFCRVPKIVTNQGEETEILSAERQTRWLAAISRADLTEKILENDRVCGIHFHSGKAAQLWDRSNPDWVPSLHLGHDKLKESDERKEKQQQERAQKITERRKREREREEKEAMQRKAVKVNEPRERIRDIYMVNEEETFGETREEDKEEKASVENIASTQIDPEGYSRSCSTQTEECDFMFRTQKTWLPQKSTAFEEDYFEGDNEKTIELIGKGPNIFFI
ncbi:chromatin assembly factor 1 subunit A-like [Stylophora pistillata]|uniref:chromatin assembly factor 1 subunit A-like n=1 Tax=Stylophora pistillata TaxID=50429 RepID=UPI000C03A075|nr:chromatin assembly factor 1 subunit A-like [Stylophora pistillata]